MPRKPDRRLVPTVTRPVGERPGRQTIRLPGYDYTGAGGYSVTICTRGRVCLLGEVVGAEVRLTEAGRLVHEAWFRTATIRERVAVDPYGFVVMPNHLHGILHLLDERDGAPAGAGEVRLYPCGRGRGPAPGSVAAILGQFKSITTKAIHAACPSWGGPIWQRGYYEHIIRNQTDLDRIRRYINENPARWTEDSEHPDRPAALR